MPTVPYAIDVSRDEQQLARDIVPFVEPAPPKRLGGEIRQRLPAWVKRIEAKSKTNEAGLSDFTVQSLQPIDPLSDADEAVFAQFRMNRNGQAEDPAAVSNVGLGYRRLMQPDLLVGVNGFYDRDWSDINDRVGADTELKWRALDFGFHYYVGLDGAGMPGSEQALDGYNLEVGTQIPYLPWARAQFSTREFFRDTDENDRANYATSVQLGLMRNLSFAAGVRGEGAVDQVGFVGVSYRFDGTPAPKLGKRYLLSTNPIAPVAFEPRDMKGHMLDKVRRIETIPSSY